jgi:addiction module HigA family antidote
MPMKNPLHPGALAKANLEEVNLSVAEAAKTMKVTRQQLHIVMQGRSLVTPEMARRFEKAFGGAAEMCLKMQAAFDLAKARRKQREMDIPRLVEHRFRRRDVSQRADFSPAEIIKNIRNVAAYGSG